MVDIIFGTLLAIIVLAASILIPFLISSLIYWVICICFGLEFMGQIALGIFLICCVIRWVLSAASGN